MFSRSLKAIAGLFECTPRESRVGWELPLLSLIIVAGAVLRFWGLGEVGLHGDEETMAMPVMHIVEHGTPKFPSGMFYGRAIGQLYLMAGSVMIFGESEWAFRLPSALCGVLLIVLAYLLGRRFLNPMWNLVFVATVAFLPSLIVVSQTARMYVFLLASLVGYMIFLFKWEQTRRVSFLLAALFMLLLALQFQTLAVFAVLLLLFPGLLHKDNKQLVLGFAAMIIGGLGYQMISTWYRGFYPLSLAHTAPVTEGSLLVERGGVLQALEFGALPLLAGAGLAIGLAWFVGRGLEGKAVRVTSIILVTAGLIAQLLLSYHFALLLLATAAVLTYRFGGRQLLPRLVVVGASSILLAVIHMAWLHAQGMESLRKILGALAGLPSVWVYFKLGEYSLVALGLVGIGVFCALLSMAYKRPVRDVWLFFVLSAWVPLLVVGLFGWYLPSRYMDFAVLPMLICAAATMQQLASTWSKSLHVHRGGGAAVACISAALMINPLAFAATWNAGYAVHPDHKGAAEFIRNLDLGPGDVVVAEDVLQQTYYLGNVDYWLLGEHVALLYCIDVNGERRDFYTNTRLIGNGNELQALLQDPRRGTIYIIGSGEEQRDGRAYARGAEIQQILRSPALEVVYQGRDGLTKIWRVSPPAGRQ